MSELTLGARMKRYEHQTRFELPRRTYTLIRLDGKAFHTYTKGLDKPFDMELMYDLGSVAASLLSEIAGAVFAYAQSDEISLLLTDFAAHGTEPWLGGGVQKMASVSASLATAKLNQLRPDGELALFDSRVWTMADPNEVMNYFIWRQRDAIKNSITMAALSVCGHKELEGLNSSERQEAMFKKGLNWNDFLPECKQGQLVKRDPFVKNGVIRTKVVAVGAPTFNANPEGWLALNIPRMPTLPEVEDA